MEADTGLAFVVNLLETLRGLGVTSTLPITTHLHLPSPETTGSSDVTESSVPRLSYLSTLPQLYSHASP